MDDSCEPKSSFIDFNGSSIWFDVYGRGPRPVLLIPGGIGTGRTDFYEQLEGDEALDFEKFTLVAVEPIGWGRSRPPVRRYSKDVYETDAKCFNQVMQHLGYDKYSVIGWSDGARTALLMAIRYSDQIQSLVLTAMSTHVSETCKKVFSAYQNVDKWDNDKIETYLRCYQSKEEVQNLWNAFTKFALYNNQYFPSDIFNNEYHLVKCPVLIFHGDRDQMIDVSQPSFVAKNIRNAKLHRMATAGHDLHQMFAIRFKSIVEDHLLGVKRQQ